MIPVLQDNRGGRGNCMAACLASILETNIDEVPDYRSVADAGGSWMNCFNTWLSKHHNVLYFELDYYLTRHVKPVGWHLMNYGDADGGHSIVGWEGLPVWNPFGHFMGISEAFKPPYSWGVLVRCNRELSTTWRDTWHDCICGLCAHTPSRLIEVVYG